MSKEVPLLASEKIKLGLLILLVAVILISALSGLWKKAYRAIVRDSKGYEKAMTEVEDLYKFKVAEYDKSLNSYNVEVDPDHWVSLNKDSRFDYCTSCHDVIRKTQVHYKMTDEDDDPVVNFFVNGTKMAQVAYGYTTVY